ncbi:GGDEF domain-containing protein [Vibrio owensii]|uniref:GGDEF domain-containing protein n=1 Tax=Vibrio owensii TaxID=696485 RepID=UPI003AB03C15
MNVNFKINKKQIIALVTFSLIQLGLLCWWIISTEREKLDHQASSFQIEIDSLKGQIFLFNELVSSVLEGKNKPEQVIGDRKIYSLDFEKFHNNLGTNVANKLNEIFSLRHSWLEFSDLLYFKFLESKTVLSSRTIGQLEPGGQAIERIFTENYCKSFYICTRYLSDDNLSDGFVFSEPHIDVDTGKKTLTIVTPVYRYNEIVAESHLDVQVDQWYSVANKYVSSARNGEFIDITIQNKEILDEDFIWTKEISIDNYVKVTFKYSYLFMIIEILMLFCIAVFVNLILILYYNQKKENSYIVNNSMLDELTGCYNRKIFNSRKLRNAVQNAKTCGVIVFDGNRIKMINDVYGHKFGDIAIFRIADTLLRSFRKEDFVIRVGGDEFVVIAPNLDSYVASVIAKEVNRTLSFVKIIDDVTVSAAYGYAECNGYDDIDAAIKHADKALYKNKKEMKSMTHDTQNLHK